MHNNSAGAVSPVLDYLKKIHHECAQIAAGMTFGEMAVIDRAPRSAQIVADTGVECDLLTLAGFDALERDQPSIKIKLPHNLCLALSSKLRKANRERSVFD